MEITPVVAAPPRELPRANGVPVARSAAEPGPKTVESVALPTGHRVSGAMLAGLALAAGVAAIVLGSIAFAVGAHHDPAAPSAPKRLDRAVAFLTRPTTRLVPLGSAGAVLAIDGRGRGYVVPGGLPALSDGKTYRLWASVGGGRPIASAAFRGGEVAVPLATPVPRGALVTITEQRADGMVRPRGRKVLVARVPA